MENEEVIKRVISILDGIREDLKEQSETLIRNTVSLEEHIKRTTLLEESVDILRTEIKPIQKHINLFEAGLKITGGIVLMLGAGASIVKILDFFIK